MTKEEYLNSLSKEDIPRGKYLELDLYWSLVHSYSNTKEL